MRLFSSSRIMIRNDLQITWVKMCLAHNLWIGGMRRGRQKTRTYGSCVTNQNGSWRLHLMSRCTNTDHPAMGHHDDEHLHENTKTAVCSDLCTILDVGFVTWSWFVLMWLDPAIMWVVRQVSPISISPVQVHGSWMIQGATQNTWQL